MRTELVEDALTAACRDRGSLAGAVFHSDHGSAQYTSADYAKLCGQLGVTQSMGAVGTSADNAMAESFNATLKRELLAGAPTFTDLHRLPSGCVPLGNPLQHPPPPLLVRLPIPIHLRGPPGRYAANRRVINQHRVQKSG